MAVKTMIEKMHEARKAYDAARDAITQKSIAEALGEVIPEGKVFVWTQITPYFNDGDPCVFRVREPFLDNDSGDEQWMHVSNWGDDWDDAVNDAWDLVSDKDLLYRAFGNDVKVIVRRGGEFVVREYHDHD